MKLGRLLLIPALLIGSSSAVPALAQTVGATQPAPKQTEAQARAKMREVVVYGNEQCPKGNGNEIIVCKHGNPDEQFRIPKQLRQTTKDGANSSWGAQQQALDGAGATGIGSCSPSGSGGVSGCGAQEFRRAKAEKKQAKADAAAEDAAIHP